MVGGNALPLVLPKVCRMTYQWFIQCNYQWNGYICRYPQRWNDLAVAPILQIKTEAEVGDLHSAGKEVSQSQEQNIRVLTPVVSLRPGESTAPSLQPIAASLLVLDGTAPSSSSRFQYYTHVHGACYCSVWVSLTKWNERQTFYPEEGASTQWYSPYQQDYYVCQHFD